MSSRWDDWHKIEEGCVAALDNREFCTQCHEVAQYHKGSHVLCVPCFIAHMMSNP